MGSSHAPHPNFVISTEGDALAAVAEKPASPPGYSSHRVLAAALFAAALLCPTPTRAQGCTQCLDTTAATPPATQRAYRHAITLMVIAAGSIFLTTLVLFKRQP